MNKNGWGLRAELGFLLLFLICLLVSTIGLHELGMFGAKDTSSINIMDKILTRAVTNEGTIMRY